MIGKHVRYILDREVHSGCFKGKVLIGDESADIVRMANGQLRALRYGEAFSSKAAAEDYIYVYNKYLSEL